MSEMELFSPVWAALMIPKSELWKLLVLRLRRLLLFSNGPLPLRSVPSCEKWWIAGSLLYFPMNGTRGCSEMVTVWLLHSFLALKSALISSWPCWSARVPGVHPLMSGLSTSAPWSSRNFATFKFASETAWWSAVVPSLLGRVTLPPYRTIFSSRSKLFSSAALHANWPTSPE